MRLSLALLLCLPAQAALTIWPIHTGTAPIRIQVPILVDGRDEENAIPAFADAQRIAAGFLADPLFTNIIASTGLPAREHFDTLYLHYPSTDNGCSVWNEPPLNTRYRCTRNYQGTARIIYPTASYYAGVDLAAAGIRSNYIAIILANTPEYGGSGGLYACASVHSSSVEIARHEVGHTFAKFADEYCTAYPGWRYAETANTSTNLASLPWRHLTAAKLLGGQYDCVNVWRSCNTCKMKSLNTEWGPVCKANYLGLIEKLTMPTGPHPPGRRTLSLRAVD